MPQIDWSQIEGYSPDLSPEEQLQLFIASPERENPALAEALQQVATLQANLNARLSDDEKNAAKQADIMKELESLRRENAMSKHKASFMAQGYDEKLAETAAAAMIDGKHITLFECMQKHQATLEKRMKEQLLKDTPRPPAEDKSGSEETDAEKVAKRLAHRTTSNSQSATDALAYYI